MIIFGSRRRKMHLGRIQYPCSRCRQLSFHTVERTQGQFTLFFVPVAPLPGSTIARCEICGHRAPLPPQMAPSWPPPHPTGMQSQSYTPPLQQQVYPPPPPAGYAPPLQQQMYGIPPLAGQAMPYATPSPFIGIGPRSLATLLDMVICFIFLVIISLLFSKTPEVAAFLFLLALLAYYIVMEACWGATMGKMALRLRIVHIDGTPISWSEALIRTLLRLVDGLFGYLLGAIIMHNSTHRQRLGDMAAKTVVIRR